MKKTLALVLALAMVFSTITVAFAEDTLGADAQICADLGMLKGETGTVDAAYVATAPTRLQAAVMFLRLKGLEAEALAFTGEENFADGNITWAEGSNLLAYLKANPQLGWVGDGVNFNPSAPITAKEYYKVLLETLGYKQTSAEVVGDFTWENVLEFAATVGLSKVADVANFTVNDLAVATVEALKINVKDTDTTLVASLVEAGKVAEAAAVAAGLMAGAPAAVAVAVDEAVAVGNAVVEVSFEDDVDAAAAGELSNYAIEGLVINAVVVTGADTVRLETAAMTSGKLYKLTVGEKTVQFAGIAKVSGGPEIEKVESQDVEEVVITFTKNIDFATGTDVANYSIAGITVVSAEVDEDEVTLTTEGLKNKTKYTVKVTNVKSVDGTAKKSDSDSFTVKYDLVAPKIKEVEVQTNQRVVVTFTEDVTQATAEDLANYAIAIDETDGAELEIVSVTWDDDDEDNVSIVTEPMEKREDYELTVNNIADERKVANVMTRPATADFEGIAEDEKEPKWETLTVLSPTTILVEFSDDSKIDEDSALDLNNYDLEDLDIESIVTLKDSWKIFKAILTVEEMETGESYDLEIVDVLDEFGNAMGETTKVAKGIASSFAAVKVVSATATDENEIDVVFSGEIDEDTAENIANYEIDEEVGVPTEADYDVDTNTVTLTVNDLVNGYENIKNEAVYDLTVDGVQDLAGNVLDYEVEVDTKVLANIWDTGSPELEDVDVIDLKTIALAFDEQITFKADAAVELWYNIEYNDAGVVVDNDVLYVDANDYADDYTVVEFSGAGLVDGEEYTVVDVVYGAGHDANGITDLIGNSLAAIKLGDFEFVGVADAAEGPEVDSYEQTNAMTFEVTMTRWVELFDGGDDVAVAVVDGDTVATVTTADGDFEVTVDEDVLTFVFDDVLVEDTDYVFDFATFVRDFHGNVAENADDDDITYLTGEYDDEDAPYVEEVIALDRETIKITFSEDITEMSGAEVLAFVDGLTLMNYDLDKEINVSMIVDEDDNDGDNVLKVHVAKPLEARYEYELEVTKLTVSDYATLENEDTESFYFDGTNLLP